MKSKGKHPVLALSATKVRSITAPGRYADGNGLYLEVDRSGAKRWMLRTVVRGKRSDIGLGGVQIVSLADARLEAQRLRHLARSGGDPLAVRRLQQRVIPTFAEAATAVHASYSPGWKNPKHSAQWINTLKQYAYPTLGDRRVDQMTTADVLNVLAPIWLKKPETARRVRQRLSSVFDWCKASGYYTEENPVDSVVKGLPRQTDQQVHHAALPYDQVGDFLKRLNASDTTESVRLAFELLILTATRTGELVGATWKEFDLEEAMWIIPPERMKAKREHRVPLAKRAIAILKRAKELAAGSEFVFPGRTSEKPLSNMAFLMTLRRMGENATAHGFRSAFRDWASERTNFPREVCEMALAHTVKDKTEAAYRRGDLLEKRRKLMATWAAFISAGSAEVVPLRA